jgi:peptide-methionine (S)-S-oxide reductase
MRLVPLFLIALGCNAGAAEPTDVGHQPATLPAVGAGQAVAVFAGGCFWCMESDFDKLPGGVATTSGFEGGKAEHPTYEQVGEGGTGHRESVRVVYDTSKLDYAKVLDWFWHHVDPTDGGGQFCDRGDQYTTAIFPVDDAQKAEAEKQKAALDASGVLGKPVVTAIVPGQTFWPAENYHQDYHLTNTAHYEAYRHGCGRDATVAKVWANAPK